MPDYLIIIHHKPAAEEEPQWRTGMGTVGGRRTVTPVSEGAGALDGAAENTNKMLASYVCLQTGSIINPYYLNNLYCTGVGFFLS